MSEIDYTSFYTRMADALETIATNSTSIKTSLEAIETDIANISTKSTTIANNQTTIANNQTTIANNQTTMANKITSIENKASNDGIRIIGPYEWLSMSALYRLYGEQRVNIDQLKQEFLSRVPKEF